MPYTPGSTHGSSIKNNPTYNALRRKGMSKGQAAAISNAQYDRMGHAATEHKGRRGRKRRS